jgi:hypothetical protein
METLTRSFTVNFEEVNFCIKMLFKKKRPNLIFKKDAPNT